MTDNESKPPPQRQRSNSNHGDERTRSQYWFEDGNVVLQAENTLFRVHRSILSRHSQIFKDTFSLPQDPSQDDNHIEGCPVVQLSDTAKDLNHVISLLYDNDKTLAFATKLPAEVVGSMLRLGKKYDIAYLEKDALARLHHDYPKRLEDWDSLSDHNQQIEGDAAESIRGEIITIAHEFNLFTILPAAYARYHRWQDLTEFSCDDNIPEAAREHCIIGCTRIVAFLKDKIADALCPPLVIPSKACSSGGKCETNRWNIIKNLPLWDTDEVEEFGIYLPPNILGTEDLCPRCRIAVKNFTIKVRSEFWSMLPTLFNLPAWADLKDDP